MENSFTYEPMLDIYIYETTQNTWQLEQCILTSEKANCFTPDTVNEIFRIMHTIKGSSAMMLYNNIASLAHSMEDLFYFIREGQPENLDCAYLSDLLLEGIDFIKLELEKVKNASTLDGDPALLIQNIQDFLISIKDTAEPDQGSRTQLQARPQEQQQYYLAQSRNTGSPALSCYEAIIHFDDGCEMENIRAYAVIHNLKEFVDEYAHYPEDLIEDMESIRIIREQGFRIIIRSDKGLREFHEFFSRTAFVRDIEINELNEKEGNTTSKKTDGRKAAAAAQNILTREQAESFRADNRSNHQNMISVDVMKLDKLMDLMGEMVIAEAMVTQNPELADLKLNSFYKASRQLRKITGELQDMVMSIRMVPLSATFHKMHRIVRDMNRKLGKEAELVLIGQETEVDKNIIEHISDPLMHLVRNSIDHGIEPPEERIAGGKPGAGQIILEARNAGSDVMITVKDDGRGLSRDKILQKAVRQELIGKPVQELTDREIYNLIFLPGFSTNENVTEFSGRGVGMDVVVKNLEAIGGTVNVDSSEGAGTVTTLKIPLTLAIIDGMNIRVGNATYTLPTTSIQETFQAKQKDIIIDPEHNEMIMVRGVCYPILRLHQIYSVETRVTELTKGIMLMVEQDEKRVCLFADELLGQHQVVVKSLPAYLREKKKVDGLAGCTLLGDGSISLILGIGSLVNI